MILSVASYFASEWIKKNWDKHFTYTTNFWGQTEAPDESVEADPDTAFTFVVNYYANKDGSGAELYELKLNYYTDYLLQDVYSLGLQIVNPGELKLGITQYHSEDNPFGDYHAYYKYYLNYGSAEVAYFNTDDGYSFDSVTTFNERNVPYIIKIDDKPFAFDFDKTISTEKIGQFLWRGSYRHYTSNFDYFLYRIYDSTTHLTAGEGIYKNLTLELTDVFNIYEYNSATGKFDILSSEFGYDVEYISFKINYYERGALRHEDSLFNQIGKETAGGVIWGN